MLKYLSCSVLIFSLVTSSIAINEEKILKLDNDLVCELCTVVLSSVETLIEQNKTETEIFSFLETNICNRISPIFVPNLTCTELMQELVMILTEAAYFTDPAAICREVKLYLILESINLEASPLVSISKTETNQTVCELCVYFMDISQYFLEEDKTEDDILNFIIKNFCNKLGENNQTCALIFVTELRPIFFEFLQNLNTTILCAKLDLCNLILNETEKQRQNQIVLKTNLQRKTYVDNIECDICKDLMVEIQNLMATNTSQADIINWLDNDFCKEFGKLSDLCRQIVNYAGPTYIKKLSNDINALKLCEDVGFCKKNNL